MCGFATEGRNLGRRVKTDPLYKNYKNAHVDMFNELDFTCTLYIGLNSNKSIQRHQLVTCGHKKATERLFGLYARSSHL